jgi:ectoine hydroxylase-related dioxygenase (phytanoyl-CoA dioxygenase family)
MNDWFNEIGTGCELPANTARDLLDSGFTVIPGPVATERLAQLADAYDSAVTNAAAPDLHVGSNTTRVHDLVNRGTEFDPLYVYHPILAVCHRVISRPFKLSSMLARTLRPHSQAQPLHVDFRSDADGWPMVGFIFMVDDFREDNGATRFVPGSHRSPAIPSDLMKDPTSDHEDQVPACGVAGSIIVYNGSVWHGHTANSSGKPRRSIQGAYIRREAQSSVNLPARMRSETLARISPLAKYVLAV